MNEYVKLNSDWLSHYDNTSEVNKIMLLTSKLGFFNKEAMQIADVGCGNGRFTKCISKGLPLHIAYASIISNIKEDIISSAVAVGIPTDLTKVGVIMEFSGHVPENYAKDVVVSMVKEAMKKREYELDKILISSCEVSSSEGEYVTAFAGLAMW